MKIKVCGMKYPDNIKKLLELPIDFMGLIFYPKSPRFVDDLVLTDIDFKSNDIQKIGVFVNSDIDFIKAKIEDYSLDFIQLHGNESPDFCRQISTLKPVVKAFSISDVSDLEKTKEYEDVCQYFLFDTKTPSYGGSGQKFDWNILQFYKGNIPFFLSGGISTDDIYQIKNIKHSMFHGIDLNSKFEKESGLKDILNLEIFLKQILNNAIL